MHLPGTTRTRPPGHRRSARQRIDLVPPSGTARRTLAAVSALLLGAGVLPAALFQQSASAIQAPLGQGFTITPSDLSFILDQIKIAEHHAYTQTADNPCGTLVGNGPNQIPSPLVSKGLRTVDGSCNNLIAGQEHNGAADQVFPRLSSKSFRPAESGSLGGPPVATTYAQNSGNVFDSQPRQISNLIVDQTSTNPAAIAAAGFPVRAQGGGDPVVACTGPNTPAGCVPDHETLFIPNVTTDVGLSPPYNSWFTLFGQFFDHGVDQTVKGGGTVFVPLKADDPLIPGPDHVLGTSDDLDPHLRFMVLTRGKNQPGADGVLGTDDDVKDALNTDSPWVDQSQTYTSHPSHQVFLREYVAQAGKPVATGKLLGGPAGPTAGGISTWATVKEQAATILGLQLTDADALDVPMLATDPYGNFIPGPLRGLPQYVTTGGGLVEGNTANPVPVPANVVHFETPFLTDIANNAVPNPGFTPDPDDVVTPGLVVCSQPGFPAGCVNQYDNEMLDKHFACGDGRCNENIGLSAVHQIFHSEHDRLVADIQGTLDQPANAALLAAYQDVTAIDPLHPTNAHTFTYGERLFQAARFVTEMEYQHLVFEEFARKVQPLINPFQPFAFTQTELNPAIKAEFAHAVYRFGHSMLTETIARRNEDKPGPDGVFGTKDDVRGTENDISLLDGFLNPPAYTDGGSEGQLTSEEAAGAIIMGMSDQVGNELDEFVTDTLRNNLLGLPLDLPTINMTRARSEGIPPLNEFRRQVFKATNDGQLKPYVNWVDFGEHLKHPESLVNFVAAYGQHPSITGVDTIAGKREAARLIVAPEVGVDTPPADAADFMNSAGTWAGRETGLNNVDLWVGGLAEVTNLFGGLLGSTFNFVFENQLTDLQNGDRLYYLARTPGMNLRTQLEGNSFAELIMRNTNAKTLKADAFATADCKFELKNLDGTPAGYAADGNLVTDDPASECDETALLIRMPDGTIKYRNRNSVDPSGINGQSVYNGTAGVDRIYGGNDSDTFWGGAGNDIIEGNDGADVALGGEGDDIITDLNGDDVPKGGPGNDAIDAGPGLDIVMAGQGKDFTNGGANINETFAGDGDDFVVAGQGEDAVFGDSGDDWEEGGDQPDLLQGDSGNLFFLDDAQKNGHDILVGQGGDDDYDQEGGDDIGVGGPGIEKVAGASGFDWEIGLGDPQPQSQDLALPLVGLDVLTVDVRDKFNEVEALSGWKHNDVLRGDSVVPGDVGGGGFIGKDFLTQEGVDRISGLAALLPDGATAGGATWGEGNILLGGSGSDVIEGRGANDIIDGDRYLNVRLSVRTNPNDPSTEIGTSGLELTGQTAMNSQYLHDGAGNPVGPTLQEAVFAGDVNPGNIVAVREILAGSGGVDTAVFSGPRTDYTITVNPNGSRTVSHLDGTGADGIDTVFNVERLLFSDQTLVIGGTNTPASGTLRVLGQAVAGQTLTADGSAIVDPEGVPALRAGDVTWEMENVGGGGGGGGGGAAAASTWTPVGTGLTFSPTVAELGNRLRAVATFTDGAGVPELVRSAPTTAVSAVNHPATGQPVLSDLAPTEGVALHAITASSATETTPTPVQDADGLGPFGYQWQQRIGGVWSDIIPATNRTFVPTSAQVGRPLRVVVSFVDGIGVGESLTSDASAPVQAAPVTPPGGGGAGGTPPGGGAGGTPPGGGAGGTPPGGGAGGTPPGGGAGGTPPGGGAQVPANVPPLAVTPSLASALSAPAVGVRATAALSGTVSPFQGVTVTLERRVGTAGWTAVSAQTFPDTATTGGFRFRIPTAASGRVAFRVKVSGPGVVTTTSAARTLAIYRAKVLRAAPSGAEYVTVRNTGKVAVNLGGWKLRDRSGATLRLPGYSLAAGATVRVYTGSGARTAGRIYLGRAGGVWDTHDTVRLFDRAGARISTLYY